MQINLTHISLSNNLNIPRLLHNRILILADIVYPYLNLFYFNENNLLNMINMDSLYTPFYGAFFTFFLKNKLGFLI